MDPRTFLVNTYDSRYEFRTRPITVVHRYLYIRFQASFAALSAWSSSTEKPDRPERNPFDRPGCSPSPVYSSSGLLPPRRALSLPPLRRRLASLRSPCPSRRGLRRLFPLKSSHGIKTRFVVKPGGGLGHSVGRSTSTSADVADLIITRARVPLRPKRSLLTCSPEADTRISPEWAISAKKH